MNIKRQVGLLGLLTFFSMAGFAEDVFFVGHSLINFNMPRMVDGLAQEAGLSHSSVVQITNGADLRYNWNNSASAQGEDSRQVLPVGDYEVLVITERVPLRNAMKYAESTTYASNFYNLAVKSHSGARVFLYETWPCVNSGEPVGCDYDGEDDIAWRTRLDLELSRWESIADAVNAQTSAPDMQIIPGGQAMAQLYDEISAGAVPGISSIKEVFDDAIHLNDSGWYFIALVHYATIYGKTPIGLSTNLTNQWGKSYKTPAAATAQKMQQIAWEVVCGYKRSGVACGDSDSEVPAAPKPPTNLSVKLVGL